MVEFTLDCELTDLIDPYCEDLVGSVYDLYIARTADVVPSSVPNCCATALATQSVRFVRGRYWRHWRCIRDNIRYVEQTTTVGGSTVWEQRLTAFRRGSSPELLSQLRRLPDGEYLLLIQLESRYWRLIGSVDNPVRLDRARWDSQEKRTSQPGAALTFERTSTNLACIISQDYELPPGPLLAPVSRLSVTDPGTCNQASLSAIGSTRTSGAGIATTTPGQILFTYTFGDPAAPLWHATIAPDGDPGDASDWTITAGSYTSGEFETLVVDRVTGGHALDFSFVTLNLARSVGSIALPVTLTVTDTGNISAPARGILNLVAPKAFRGTLSSTSQLSMRVGTLSDCTVLVDYGDGTDDLIATTGGNGHDIQRTYGSAGDYEVELYGSPDAFRLLDFTGSGDAFADLEFSALSELEELRLTGAKDEFGGLSIRSYRKLQVLTATNIDVDYFDALSGSWPELTTIDLRGNLADGATIDLNNFPNIETGIFDSMGTDLKLSAGVTLRNLSSLSFRYCGIDDLDTPLAALYEMREEVVGTPTLDFHENPGIAITSETQAKVDELENDYGWTIHLTSD